jgi:hypothetical protein
MFDFSFNTFLDKGQWKCGRKKNITKVCREQKLGRKDKIIKNVFFIVFHKLQCELKDVEWYP